jgi:hypothetical protein
VSCRRADTELAGGKTKTGGYPAGRPIVIDYEQRRFNTEG